jgi:putative chitinase
MSDETPAPRPRPTCPSWLWRLLLVSWEEPATGKGPEPLSLAGLLRRHLAQQWRRHASQEKTPSPVLERSPAVNRKRFYDVIRTPLFGGTLAQSQVDGLEHLLDYAELHEPPLDLRHVAYILATALHETARTMQPIEEYGKGQGKPYGVPDPITGETYHGRGLVQITWKKNYAFQQAKLGRPLVQRPDCALEPDCAAAILYEGMGDGDFTGVSVGDYIHEGACDYTQARRVVNGLDCAEQIAGYAQVFQEALIQAICPCV